MAIAAAPPSQLVCSFENTLAQIEWPLNIAGYIPGVSTCSGSIRYILGIIQIVAGISIAILCSLAALFVGCCSKNVSQNLRGKATCGSIHMFHGVGNIFRATIELVPLLGNLICLIHDQGMKLRWQYPNENIEPIRMICN